jgi:hypothetical protein
MLELIVNCQGFAKGILVELIFLSEKNSGNGKPGLFFARGLERGKGQICPNVLNVYAF